MTRSKKSKNRVTKSENQENRKSLSKKEQSGTANGNKNSLCPSDSTRPPSTTPVSTAEAAAPAACHPVHSFTIEEITALRKNLLEWYDKHKRSLPWRDAATSDSSENQRAYAVLVSEMMLQQTQVATVLAYYERWMARWPTLADLAGATLEQVNEMWAGLGYYSRGRRLHEIACKVHTQMDGEMPNTSEKLLKLPGVGRYTAGAVASIVFSETTPVVDGNVVRVMARLRAIGACTTLPVVTKAFWELAAQAVDLRRAGDFNQALMELGATICTPKNPQCDSCPVSHLCLAFKKSRKTASKAELADIEEVPECNLCLSAKKWDASLGVMNFPRKEKKTNVSQQETAVCVIHRENENNLEFFLEKRPKEGLLANLWQFPNIPLTMGLDDSKVLSAATQGLEELYGVSQVVPRLLGRVPHQFSHISQVYVVLSVRVPSHLEPQSPAQAQQWSSQEALGTLAIPTGMKKVFKLFSNSLLKKNQQEKLEAKRKRNPLQSPEVARKKNNRLVTDFFKTKSKST